MNGMVSDSKNGERWAVTMRDAVVGGDGVRKTMCLSRTSFSRRNASIGSGLSAIDGLFRGRSENGRKRCGGGGRGQILRSDEPKYGRREVEVVKMKSFSQPLDLGRDGHARK
ncbi:uncharacterized protein SPSK_10722 [Sporothrix schenckii 1099-18]|uniref:Uncharacterized protein n=1 Tax=Sporothrix schenckii 1099-18 TaxID=1397361 RepID=A0A0F2MJ82_SPOSC|nr:uncharacterized protein SPSK_10722 [Sporothrix schenckii 1099-18]KJR89677.1 hypothetical protein SPSK_10722 [Sporothrix schenckii 1099-18]